MSTKQKFEIDINRLRIMKEEVFDELMDTEDDVTYAELLSRYNSIGYELNRLESFYNRYLKED